MSFSRQYLPHLVNIYSIPSIAWGTSEEKKTFVVLMEPTI